jgi:hypothetical protein
MREQLDMATTVSSVRGTHLLHSRLLQASRIAVRGSHCIDPDIVSRLASDAGCLGRGHGQYSRVVAVHDGSRKSATY